MPRYDEAKKLAIEFLNSNFIIENDKDSVRKKMNKNEIFEKYFNAITLLKDLVEYHDEEKSVVSNDPKEVELIDDLADTNKIGSYKEVFQNISGKKKTYAEIINNEEMKSGEKIKKLIEMKECDDKRKDNGNVIIINTTEESILKENLRNIQVKGCFIGTGETKVLCSNNKQAIDAVEAFKNKNINATIREPPCPKMIIKNVQISITDEEIINDIRIRNNIDDPEIKVVANIKRNNDFKNVVILVSNQTRQKILKKSNCLFIGFQLCKIHDNVHVMQCFHCQKFGHKYANCPNKNESVICLYCSKNHKSSECPNKRHKDSYLCSNCQECHTSNNVKCKVYLDQVSKKINHINYSLN